MNTRRIGAIASGPLIALGSSTALGSRGIFLGCALVTVAALAIIKMVSRRTGTVTADQQTTASVVRSR